MSTLLYLPNEILDLIIHFAIDGEDFELRQPFQVQRLLPLCIICRSLFPIAKRYLFRYISIKIVIGSSLMLLDPAPSLLRHSLDENAALEGLIKEVRIRLTIKDTLEETLLSSLLATKAWEVTSILLQHLSDIQEFDFDESESFYLAEIFEAMQNRNLQLPWYLFFHTVRTLKNLQVLKFTFFSRVEISVILPFLKSLCYLRKLTIVCGDHLLQLSELSDIEFTISNRLQLDFLSISGPLDYKILIQECDKIKELDWQDFKLHSKFLFEPIPNVQTVSKSISSTLSTIHLICYVLEDSEMPDLSQRQLIGLSKLETVKLQKWVFSDRCWAIELYQCLLAGPIQKLFWQYDEDCSTRLITSLQLKVISEALKHAQELGSQLRYVEFFLIFNRERKAIGIELHQQVAAVQSQLLRTGIFAKYAICLNPPSNSTRLDYLFESA
jgi:hypothetical protein